MDLTDTRYKDVEWIHLVQDKGHWWSLVDVVKNLKVP
jgi:hypothetical protein